MAASSLFAYNFRKSITIDRTKISDPSCGASLLGYPMLFSLTDVDLAHTSSGGQVTDLGGDDIIFVGYDEVTCGGPSSCTLAHEIERYDSATGELVAWVNVPHVNTDAASSNTVLYVYYGDNTVTSPTENPTAVWDVNYQSVWHLEEAVIDEATGGVHIDSTSNGNDGTQEGNAGLAGQIADGQDFDGVDDQIAIGTPTIANAVTVSAWIKHDTLPALIQDYIDLGNDVFIRHDGQNGVGQLDFALRSGSTTHFRSNGALTTGAWYHVAGTWDGTTMRLFNNGAEVLPALTPGITLGPLGGQFSISNGTETMDGVIDEARVSDIARSACWIGAEYNNQAWPDAAVTPAPLPLNNPGGGFYAVGVATPATWNAPSFTTAGTGDGIVVWDGGLGDDLGAGVRILNDSKVLVSGYTQTAGGRDFILWRFNADGTLDPSFGGGDGIVTTDFSGNTDSGFNVELQGDKILVSGVSNDDFALVRYNSDGSLDTSFGTGGRVTTDINATDVTERMVVQPDGKILLSGTTGPATGGSNDWALIRYNADGSIDTGFGTLGIVTEDWNGGGNDVGRDLLLQPDGKILFSGRGPAAEGTGVDSTFNIARYNADGTLDTSFGVGGTNGFAAFDVAAGHDFAYGIALQNDGKILQVGEQNNTKEIIVVRWNSDGTVDTTFNGVGFVSITAGTSILDGRDIHVRADGKLVISGRSNNGVDYDVAILRLNPDGSTDASFDTDGIAITPVLASHDVSLDSAVTPDGAILDVAYVTNGTPDLDLGFLRYNNDGSLDTDFDGTTTLDGAPTFIEGGTAVVLDTNVTVRDVELDALNGGNGNYNGARVVLARNGGAIAEDVFSFIDGNGITLSGGNLLKSSQVIATFDTTTTPGELSIAFTDANGQIPTSADVDNVLRQITYANSSGSPPSSAQIDWTFLDDGGLATTGATTVMVTGRYDFRKRVTIDRGQLSDPSCGATLTNFPMLFNSVDPDLRHTSFGGDVTDLSGDDIVFQAFDTTTCGGPTSCTLEHEIERYNLTTGELVAWVRLPSVNTAAAASDTVIFLTYGNNQVTSPTENPAGVWDGNYRGVWHLGDGDSTAAGFYQNSTVNNEDGTLTDADGDSAAVAGQIGGGFDFNGDADRIDIANFSQYLTTAMTISGWVRPSAPHPDHDGYFGIRNADVDHSFYILQLANTNDLEFRFRNDVGTVYNDTVVSAVSVGTWVYLTLTYDGSELVGYVDGQLVSQDPTATGVFSSSAFPFSIGAVGGNELDGTVDEVRVSDTARNACWVSASYNNQAWPDKAVTPSPDPSPNPSEGFYGLGAPTAVELVSFTAMPLDGAVELFWETGSELDNLGFHLYRATSASGPWDRVTTSLVPGLGSSPEGASYRFVDTSVVNDATYYYTLEDIDTSGESELHGPVAATPSASTTRPPDDDHATRITYGSPEASALHVESKKDGVVLTLETGGFVAMSQEDGSVVLEVPGLEEIVGASLPAKRTWVEAVAGRDVNIVSVRARKLERFEGLRPSGELVGEVEATRRATVHVRLERGARSRVQREGARLLQTAYQGETKKARFELAPFAWDGSALVLAKTLEVRVAFRGREASRTPRRRGKASVRLVTVERGLYAVPLRELFGRRITSFRLSRQGEDVAYHVEDGLLYFWSDGADENPYGREAVYELEPGEPGTRMELTSGSSNSDWYWDEVEREENRYYQAALIEAPDRWLWDALFPSNRKSYRFELADSVAGGTSHLDVWLQGASDTAHHVRAYVNGGWAGEARWVGKQSHALSLELLPDVVQNGENVLELETVAGAGYSLVMLDRFRVRYHRATTVLESARYVLDISEGTPRWAMSGFDSESRYVASDVALRPEVRAVRRTKLRTDHQTDYLVIGPEAFLNEARPLLRHRAKQGLRVMTASTDDIASEFGWGELTSESIREFIADVYHHARGRKLRYVLLLGDATYDYKDYLGTGVVNQVPPYMVRTSYLWTASDPTYAAVNGDDELPDVAIGRLPAANEDELRQMVEKILAYEAGERAAEPVVLVSDNADEAGEFPRHAERLAAGVLADHAPHHISLETLGVDDVRREITDAFDRGAFVVSYLGHGGIHLWADENVLNSSSVAALSPQPNQPILLTMNCLNGYFHFPYFNALSEAFVKAEGKGAIAAFSPSGLSLNGPAQLYHEALLKELFEGGHERLGDAVVAAQESYADSGALPELLSIYHLIGDPALELR
jgi:uncharacterized delta-60 repeat protein